MNYLTKLGKRLKKQQLTINYKIKILYNKILIIKKFDNLTYKNIMKIHNILIYKNEENFQDNVGIYDIVLFVNKN